MNDDDDALSDDEAEKISEQAYEAALHATTPHAVKNPYPCDAYRAALFNSLFINHYAMLNGK